MLCIKPVDNSGGRGISICKNELDLKIAYEKALYHSQTNSIIVEPYMTEKEVTIFYAIHNGEFYLTAMGDRHTKYNQNDVIPLPVAYSFPSKNLKKYQESLSKE